MNIKIAYWRYTSGEDGVHGFDWGVKHCSPSLEPAQALDVNYRLILKEFNLSPSLEIPNDGNSGLLVLNRGGKIFVGFVFPGKDLKDCPNTSSIICQISEELTQYFTLNEFCGGILASNDIKKISQHGVKSSDFLCFNGKKILRFDEEFLWPEENQGFFKVNGEKKILSAFKPEKINVNKKNSYAKLFASCAVVFILGAFCIYKFYEPQTAPEINVEHENNLPVQEDKHGQDQSEDSPKIPEKSPKDRLKETLVSFYNDGRVWAVEGDLITFGYNTNLQELPSDADAKFSGHVKLEKNEGDINDIVITLLEPDARVQNRNLEQCVDIFISQLLGK